MLDELVEAGAAMLLIEEMVKSAGTVIIRLDGTTRTVTACTIPANTQLGTPESEIWSGPQQSMSVAMAKAATRHIAKRRP